MKIGVNIPNYGPGATPESLRRWAEVARQLGYPLVMLSDHVAGTPDVEDVYPSPFYDPFATLAWLAGVTPGLELGTTVIVVPYRHPLLTARLADNLHRISGGRFILGAGVGWARQEYEALGLPFARRGEITDEYLSVIVDYWKHEVVTHQGEFASFQDARTAPSGTQRSHPRLWIGGSSHAALRRAVRFGGAWHPLGMTMPWLTEVGLPRIRQWAERQEAPVPALAPRIKLRITEPGLDEFARPAGTGTLEQIRRDIEQLAALGAEYVVLDTYTQGPEQTLHPERDWELLELVGRHVLGLVDA